MCSITPEPGSPTTLIGPQQLKELAAAVAYELERRGVVAPLHPLAVSYETAASLLDFGCSESIRKLANRGDLERTWLTPGAPRITTASLQALIERNRDKKSP